MPVPSPRNDFYNEQMRFTEKGFAQPIFEFDPTGGMEEDDSEDDGD